MESLSQAELASRLTLNCGSSYVHVDKLQQYCVTIIDVFDDCAIASPVCEDMYRSYPNASMAHLKNGGNFFSSYCDPTSVKRYFPFKAISLTLVVATKLIFIFRFIYFDLREHAGAIVSTIELNNSNLQNVCMNLIFVTSQSY